MTEINNIQTTVVRTDRGAFSCRYPYHFASDYGLCEGRQTAFCDKGSFRTDSETDFGYSEIY